MSVKYYNIEDYNGRIITHAFIGEFSLCGLACDCSSEDEWKSVTESNHLRSDCKECNYHFKEVKTAKFDKELLRHEV